MGRDLIRLPGGGADISDRIDLSLRPWNVAAHVALLLFDSRNGIQIQRSQCKFIARIVWAASEAQAHYDTQQALRQENPDALAIDLVVVPISDMEIALIVDYDRRRSQR